MTGTGGQGIRERWLSRYVFPFLERENSFGNNDEGNTLTLY